MIERYVLVSERIRRELPELERVVARVERAVASAQRHPEDQDLYLDSAALNLHDFYVGLERVLHYIAVNLDRSMPAGSEWHRELLLQMNLSLPQIRPPVLSSDTIKALDEYRRFRHLVRNVYAFEFDPERLQERAGSLRVTFERVRSELLAFADFLDQLARSA